MARCLLAREGRSKHEEVFALSCPTSQRQPAGPADSHCCQQACDDVRSPHPLDAAPVALTHSHPPATPSPSSLNPPAAPSPLAPVQCARSFWLVPESPLQVSGFSPCSSSCRPPPTACCWCVRLLLMLLLLPTACAAKCCQRRRRVDKPAARSGQTGVGRRRRRRRRFGSASRFAVRLAAFQWHSRQPAADANGAHAAPRGLHSSRSASGPAMLRINKRTFRSEFRLDAARTRVAWRRGWVGSKQARCGRPSSAGFRVYRRRKSG